MTWWLAGINQQWNSEWTLFVVERSDTSRAVAGDQAAFDAAYAEGLRDPLAVLNAAHCPRAP